MQVKESVEQRFGDAAARYARSAVHRGGPDLDLMLEVGLVSGRERVLDVGCGPGHAALAFAERGASLAAVDLSEAMLEQARRLAAERGLADVEFRRGDVESLPFPDASFEVVTSRYSAHHYPHPERALAEVARVLRPGGCFLLSDTVAPEDHTLDTFFNTIELLRDPSHVRDHRVSEWKAMLEAAGLRVEELRRAWLPIEFEPWIWRMATPPTAVAAIRALFAEAPGEVREAFALECPESHDFRMPTAVLAGRLEA